MVNDPTETAHLLGWLRGGDRRALTDLFHRYRARMMSSNVQISRDRIGRGAAITFATACARVIMGSQ